MTPPDSVLGRLLQELSWEGKNIARYRHGGAGYENVLTAEAFIGLDFLPREAFLGAVLRRATGADTARAKLAQEIEDAQITVLPDEVKLRPSQGSYQDQLVVQPDALISSPNCFALVEAKRIRGGAFQAEQLSREYVAVMRDAGGRTPLLLLLLGAPPPVVVKGLGRLSLEDAVLRGLGAVLATAEDHGLDEETLRAGLPGALARITWQEIGEVVRQQQASFRSSDPAVEGTVERLADSVVHAIERHA